VKVLYQSRDRKGVGKRVHDSSRDARTQRRMGHQTHLLIMRISESEPRAQASGSMINGLFQQEPHIDAPEF